MKITFITEHYPAAFKTYFDTQFADLVARGHDVTILAGGRLGNLSSAKIERWGLAGRTTYYPIGLRTLYRAAPAIPAAALLAMTNRPPSQRSVKRSHLTLLRIAMVRRTRPDIVFIHGLAAGAYFHGIGRGLPDATIGLYYHGGEVPGVEPIDDQVATRVFAEADHVFTNTRFSADHAIDRGCPADRITVLPVGFDLEAYPDPGPRPRSSPIRLLSAGRMSEEKGFVHALEAVRLLRDRDVKVRYTLTGHSSPYRTSLQRYVSEHELEERVTFAGTVTTEQLIELMVEADVLLLPSLHIGNWAENQAAAVQEALLLRSAVITATTGGVPESIPPVAEPFQVPPASPVRIASAIERIMALDDHEWNQLTRRGRAFVEQHYDIRELNRRMLEVLTG